MATAKKEQMIQLTLTKREASFIRDYMQDGVLFYEDESTQMQDSPEDKATKADIAAAISSAL